MNYSQATQQQDKEPNDSEEDVYWYLTEVPGMKDESTRRKRMNSMLPPKVNTTAGIPPLAKKKTIHRAQTSISDSFASRLFAAKCKDLEIKPNTSNQIQLQRFTDLCSLHPKKLTLTD